MPVRCASSSATSPSTAWTIPLCSPCPCASVSASGGRPLGRLAGRAGRAGRGAVGMVGAGRGGGGAAAVLAAVLVVRFGGGVVVGPRTAAQDPVPARGLGGGPGRDAGVFFPPPVGG